MAQSKSIRLMLTVVLFTVIVLATSTPVIAVVNAGQEVVLDFTQPDKIKQFARWTAECRIDSTRDGLGWDGPANAGCDVVIETVKPIAVGWSWHPVTTVNIETEVIPAGKFTFRGSSGVSFPHAASAVYARYSPDGKHWSTWQTLMAQVPRDKERPRLWIRGRLRVPHKARKRYTELLREFSGTERPIGVDEEAAVRWILEKQPDFFEHELPFIGYIEFLYETFIKGNQRLKQLRINLSYSRGGQVSIPPGHRENNRWRFKTDQQQSLQNHTDWISECIKRTQSIKPGATRSELFSVFTTEGGLSSRLWRTYVYRDCPYIKVDVKFKAVDNDKWKEKPGDIITEISRPYLQWSIMD